MPKEKIHIPGVSTTPEQILEERETEEETAPLEPEQIKEQVSELFELSAARAEAGKHAREAWGGLTKKEREGLKAKGEEEVLARLEAARLDPELAEFCETALEEYDNRIAELSSNPKVLNEYKSQFGKLKETLASVLSYEHLSKEKEAVSKAEEKLIKLYESIGKTPGPIERKKLKELEIRKNEIEKSLNKFELSPEMVDMLQAREIRRIQKDLERYSFAETESRTDLIREVLPDLLQGAPVLFQGETGSGKSQLAKYISEKYLNKNPAVISISEQIKESQIIGSRGLEAGQTVFNYSEFVKAQKEGRPAILDEINLMPHEFAGILHDLLQKRVGNVWIHPVTGEEIIIRSPIMATANLKSERYKQRYELDVATLRRFIGGAGAREIHYHDIGKKDSEGNLIAPETLKILSAVLANRHGEIQWDKKDASQKAEELRRFIQACRKIQEDFTLSVREDAEESLSRGDRLAFRELVITLKDQIEIMKAWKASGFREPLDSIVLKEFFHKAEISGRAAKDRENMVKVFIANKLFQDTKPEEFKIQGLSPNAIRQWQGKE